MFKAQQGIIGNWQRQEQTLSLQNGELRPRGAINGAAGDSGLVRTQSGSGPPTFGIVRTHEQFWEVR